MKLLNVMIVGGCGYLGTLVTELFLFYGHKVTVVDPLWFGNHLTLGDRADNFKLIEAEVQFLSNNQFAGYDAVIYLGGLSNDPMADYDPLRNYEENAAVAVWTAQVAKKCGVPKFIYASSGSVYGKQNSNVVCTEDSKPRADYPYGISKHMAEAGLLLLASKKFDVMIFRMATLGGLSPRMRYDLVINKMTRDALRTGKITVDNPKVRRPILYVQDAARYYLAAVGKQFIHNIYNISSGNFTIKVIAHLVQKRVEEKSGVTVTIKENNSIASAMRDYAMDCSRAHAEFGPLAWTNVPIIEMVDGIIKSTTWADSDVSPYCNIEVFKSQLIKVFKKQIGD